MPEILILAFDGSETYSFVRQEKHSFSVFGGPSESKIIGNRFGSVRLHQIARLNHNHLPTLGTTYAFDLPLHYAMCYGGDGDVTYQFEHDDITILEMSQKKPGYDFPYQNYPALLPYVPLAVAKRKKQSWRQFAAQFPNMPDDQPSDLIVVVPPPMTLGVSLWGRWGDAEGVSIVFECNLKGKRVKAYNVCT
jgi:hypothetical protein